MRIMFKINQYKVFVLTFGRNLPWCKSSYLIIGEIVEYDEFMNVEYAKCLFSLFPDIYIKKVKK